MRLQINHLVAERGGRYIFGPLSLQLKAGQCLVVRGENGAGKSTLLRSLSGLLPPGSGEIIFENGANNPGEPLANACHYLGHQDGLKPALSVSDNLAFYQKLYCTNPAQPKPTIRQTLEKVALANVEYVPLGALSAGMRKRVALARLLLNFRPIWLLDEPGAHLDTTAQNTLADIIAAHLESHGLVIITTHQPLALNPTMDLYLDKHTSVHKAA